VASSMATATAGPSAGRLETIYALMALHYIEGESSQRRSASVFQVSDHRRRAAAAVLGACVLSGAAGAAHARVSPEARLLGAVEAVCGGDSVHAAGGEIAVADSVLVDETPLVVRGREVGTRRRYAIAEGGGEVLLETIAPGGNLRRISVQHRAPLPARDQDLHPALLLLADGQCRVQTARRLVYDAAGEAQTLEVLAPSLDAVETREPVNPAVPVQQEGRADPPETPPVRVAMVDSGVNYLLPDVAARLARAGDGEILGFDYWDMDRRPFDSNPARSPFFPQRHGTQSASLVLREAPVAELVPYRYPRPEMARMANLVDDAAANGIVVVNMSLGGNRADAWRAFRDAASAHPEMLFVVSAGNNGRDIDSQPVFPASLALDNLLVVSSADSDGRPARGSNWGRESVDLLVPGEELLVTDFYGLPRLASGSTYAAARVSALAACLLAANPEWRAEELKSAILALAEAPPDGAQAYSAYGFLADPGARQRGGCAAMPRQVAELERLVWSGEDLAGVPEPVAPTHALRPIFVVLDGNGWDLDAIRGAAGEAAGILAQCGIVVPEVTVRLVEGPERASIFRDDWSSALVSELEPRTPTVYFIRDIFPEFEFDDEAQALGRSNTRRRPKLADTVWMTVAVQDLGISLAHELYHALADSGQHAPETDNLMHARTGGDNTRLRASQCLRLIRVGEAFGNLTPIN